jgi:hypothetical protein
MTLLLIVISWIVVISFVIALCVAARRGDLQDEDVASPAQGRTTQEPLVISAHVAARRRSRHADASTRMLGVGGASG